MRIHTDGIREYPALCLMIVRFIMSKPKWTQADIDCLDKLGFKMTMEMMSQLRDERTFRRNYLLLKSG